MANVPNTTTFSLLDVYNAVYSHNTSVQGNLSSCFTYSVDSYFDVNYKGSKNSLYNFRNYTVSLNNPSISTGIYDLLTSTSVLLYADPITIGGASAQTNATIMLSTTSNFASYTELASPNPTSLAQFSRSFTGLSPNTQYYYRGVLYTTSYNSQTVWYGATLTFHTPVVIGDTYGGGYVAYLYQSGDPGYVSGEYHGIIVATADLSSGIQWWNGTYITIGSTSTTMGTGVTNTANIIATQGSGSYAASICDSFFWGGYFDWCLPSLGDLDKIYDAFTAGLIGTFDLNMYWSSSEYNNTSAWYFDFTSLPGAVGAISKGNSSNNVRPVRYF